MNKKYLLLSLFCVLLCVGACKKDDEKKKAAEEAAEGELPVAVARPMVESVTLTQSFPGTLQARQEVDIVARVDGILKVHVQPGAKVRKGQLIYSIENSKYANAVQEAQANLANYQSAYDYYSRQYEATKKAFGKDAVSEMELLEAENNMKQSQASIRNAQAALNEARTMLGYCNITAPFDGTIAMQAFDQGSYVSGEASPVKLNTIYNDDVVYGYISIDDSRFAQMTENRASGALDLDSVAVVFNVPLQHQYRSALNYSAPSVATSTGTVTLRFEIANPYGELRSGMYAKVRLPYAKADNALLIRDASIGTDQQGKYVYTVNDKDEVIYTPIEVGELYSDTLRIVTKGLTADSRYVTQELLKVKDGMKVKPF